MQRTEAGWFLGRNLNMGRAWGGRCSTSPSYSLFNGKTAILFRFAKPCSRQQGKTRHAKESWTLHGE